MNPFANRKHQSLIKMKLKPFNINFLVLIALLYGFAYEPDNILALSNGEHQNQSTFCDDTTRTTIVFVPGDGGSRMEAKLDKDNKVHRFCATKKEWFDIWLAVHLLVPVFIDCFVDNMLLTYDNVTRKSYNTPGVEIRPVSFGLLDGVEYLERNRLPKTDYFANIIDELVENNHYQRNIDMVAAPYDFRKAPHELSEFFTNLTSLIETSYATNNCSKMTLICHSMGCLNSVHLLNGKSLKWKNKYIRRLISIAAPWSGSFKAIHAMLFGDKLGVAILDGKVVRKLQGSFPSLFYLFPRSPAYSKDRLLIETTNKNYTLENIDELFEEMENIPAKYMLKDAMAVAKKLAAPQVEVWCLYSSGIETATNIIYDGSIDEDNKSTTIYGNGDGTVNFESLSSCRLWTRQQSQPIHIKEFKGVTHIGMLRSKEVSQFISEQIMRTSDPNMIV